MNALLSQTSNRPLILQVLRWLPAALALMTPGCEEVLAQTTLNNPLIRPTTLQRDPAQLPPGQPPAQSQAGRNAESSAQAKSLQEEVNANLQRMNAERVPQPLRLLLSSIYVSAINGEIAVLRQPLPPMQQAMLSGIAGGGIPGMPGMATGMSGAAGMTTPGATGIPGAGMGSMMGGMSGAPLSGLPGMVNPFASPPPRPTSIRVRNGQAFSLQGYELIPIIRDFEVTLMWSPSEDRQTIVFQSGIESPSLPAYVPVANILEKADGAYYNRVQATGSATGSATTGIGGGR